MNHSEGTQGMFRIVLDTNSNPRTSSGWCWSRIRLAHLILLPTSSVVTSISALFRREN